VTFSENVQGISLRANRPYSELIRRRGCPCETRRL